MSGHRAQIAAALGAAEILGPARYAWLGRPGRPLTTALAAELDAPARRAYLVACLREELYASFYCHGRPVAARWGEPDPGAPDPWLADALSAANCGSGTWESGWTVERVEDGHAVIAGTRLRVRVPLADCRAARGAVAPGAAVRVRIPKELPAWSPGFYTAVGDAGGPPSADGMVRVYWNVGRPGAAALVGALTTRLNRAGVPFRLKVADHPYRFARCDAAVLYLGADRFRATSGALRDVAGELGGRLRSAIPAFTRRLVPGVGLAEEFGGGQSFGERRCALLADAIVHAAELGCTGAATRLVVVADRFAADGVSIDAPYREPALAGRHVL
jgi:hypothetical protein